MRAVGWAAFFQNGHHQRVVTLALPDQRVAQPRPSSWKPHFSYVRLALSLFDAAHDPVRPGTHHAPVRTTPRHAARPGPAPCAGGYGRAQHPATGRAPPVPSPQPPPQPPHSRRAPSQQPGPAARCPQAQQPPHSRRTPHAARKPGSSMCPAAGPLPGRPYAPRARSRCLATAAARPGVPRPPPGVGCGLPACAWMTADSS